MKAVGRLLIDHTRRSLIQKEKDTKAVAEIPSYNNTGYVILKDEGMKAVGRLLTDSTNRSVIQKEKEMKELALLLSTSYTIPSNYATHPA